MKFFGSPAASIGALTKADTLSYLEDFKRYLSNPRHKISDRNAASRRRLQVMLQQDQACEWFPFEWFPYNPLPRQRCDP